MHFGLPSRALAAVILASLLLASGCGDDKPTASDKASAPVTTSAVHDTATFCTAAGNLLQALSSDADPSKALAAAVAAAPGSVGDHLEAMGRQFGQAAASGDDAAFLDDDLREVAATAHEDIARTCDFQMAEITATDYAFDGVPSTLDQGHTAFHLTNQGNEVHEAILYRRAKGTKGDLIDIVNEDPAVSDGRLEEVGTMLPAGPGEESVLLSDLEAGDYVIVCFVPVGTTSMDQIRAGDGGGTHRDHRSQGMITRFTVG